MEKVQGKVLTQYKRRREIYIRIQSYRASSTATDSSLNLHLTCVAPVSPCRRRFSSNCSTFVWQSFTRCFIRSSSIFHLSLCCILEIHEPTLFRSLSRLYLVFQS